MNLIRRWPISTVALLALLLSIQCVDDLEVDESASHQAIQETRDGASYEPEEPLTEPATEPRQTTETRAALPTGEVLIPTQLFDPRGDALDRRILEANPRLYLYADHDPRADKILIVGMPGWGGRSENFIWTLVNGLKREGLTSRLVVATIQDLHNGGPRYQGQGARANANVWSVGRDTVEATRRFLSVLAGRLGRLQVYFMGFSTGGTSAPLLATRVAESSEEEGFTVAGAISMGTESPVSGAQLIERGQRVLFLVVPKRRPGEPKPMRDDQWNRISAERAFERLAQERATVYLRHVVSARRHVDWHWGLVSQCRYFRTKRIDEGRGYWPNYWMPNPETMAHLSAFLLGEEPPEEGTGSSPPTVCPY